MAEGQQPFSNVFSAGHRKLLSSTMRRRFTEVVSAVKRANTCSRRSSRLQITCTRDSRLSCLLPFFLTFRPPPMVHLLIEQFYLPFLIHRRASSGSWPVTGDQSNSQCPADGARVLGDRKRSATSRSKWSVQKRKPELQILDPNWAVSWRGSFSQVHSPFFDLDVYACFGTTKQTCEVSRSSWFPVRL